MIDQEMMELNGNSPETAPQTDAPIQINGFQQVIDMLRVADPAFRESLLRRIAVRDRKLAYALREEMSAYGL